MPELYPEYIAWELSLEGVDDAAKLFSPKTAARLVKDEATLQAKGFALRVLPFEGELVDAYKVLYLEFMASKKSPSVTSIDYHVERAKFKERKLYLLALEKDDTLLGGVLFYLTASGILKTVLRAFPHKIEGLNLLSNIALVAQHRLFAHALEKGMKVAGDGKGKNLFGQHTTIGLALFKLRLGFLPRSSIREEILPLDTVQFADKEDTLVFLAEQKRTLSKHAILFSSKSPEELQAAYPPLFGHAAFTIEVRPFPLSS